MFAVLTFPAAISFVVVIYNFFTADVMKKNDRGYSSHKFREFPGISVLVPARNEEKNIGTCLDSLTSLDYPDYEVIVMDDKSTDRTAEIVAGYAVKDPRVKLASGEELPAGWVGKVWACHQLSKAARGEYLIFIDADVTFAPDALKLALYNIEKDRLDFFSVFPKQVTHTFGENILTPLMHWLLLAFLPMRNVLNSRNLKFAAANGQFIMMKREVYKAIGGHEAVKNRVVEDMELVRLAKSKGFRTLTGFGGDQIFCRMYDGYIASLRGFSKNFFPGFGMPAPAFTTMLIFFNIVFFLPFLLFPVSPLFLISSGAILLSRVLISYIAGDRIIINTLIHIVQMPVMLYTGIRSVIFTKKGKNVWKDRVLNL
ncbi:MAG: glycosyltransferase [Ignavibacteriaceae bacterium]|nr:glycosyltransferase [Ignavibacteriaceae bacterium]